jgi:arylsulfatase A-like enzyme
LLILGAWLGIAYGLLEGLEFTALGFVPGALAWRSGNAPRVLWVAPLVYGLAFTIVAALVAMVARVARRIDWAPVLFFVLAAAGGYLGASLQGELFSPWSSALLGVGAATQLTRLFRRHRETWTRAIHRSLPALAMGVAAIALIEVGAARLSEWWQLRRLPALTGQPPNVLLLVLDTLRADHVSSYGYHRPTTPHLDRLAAESVVFEHAYSNSSWTLPAHASLMTGRYVFEHRAGEERRPYLDNRFPTLATQLRARGYATGGFVANTFWCGRQTGLNRGFIHYEDFYGSAADAFARTVLGRLLTYSVLPRFGFVDIPGRKSAARVNADLLTWVDGLGGRPFFAFVNYLDVHGPYLPPAPYHGRFASASAASSSATTIELGAITGATTVPPMPVLQGWIDRYDESLAYLDAQLGVLVDRLRERGLLDRTLLIVTSDHGEAWGEHQLVYHGNSLYLHQIRVPLLVRYPALERNGRRELRPAALDRVPATVGTVLGGSLADAFPGESLLKVHAAADVDGVTVAEVGRRRGVPRDWPTAAGWIKGLQTDRWQLILSQSGRAQLFDLQADPRQEHDLARRAQPALVRDLRAKLAAVLQSRPNDVSRKSDGPM